MEEKIEESIKYTVIASTIGKNKRRLRNWKLTQKALTDKIKTTLM